MNYLAHLHLGGQRPEELLGSLYGDFVKGRLQGEYSPQIEAAIQLHRSIDVFTDAHPLVDRSLSRFSQTRRRYAGIVLDVFFDHCLARDWAQYGEGPLDRFTSGFYRVLAAQPQLPRRLAAIAPHMAAHDWLGSYARRESVDAAVRGISTRHSRNGDRLVACLDRLRADEAHVQATFEAFFPDLLRAADGLRQAPPGA